MTNTESLGEIVMTEQVKRNQSGKTFRSTRLLVRIPLTLILAAINYLLLGDFFSIIYTIIAPEVIVKENIPFYVAFAVCTTVQISLDQIQIKAKSQLTRSMATFIDILIKFFGFSMVTILNWDTIRQTSIIKIISQLAPAEHTGTYEIAAAVVTVVTVTIIVTFIDRAVQEDI